MNIQMDYTLGNNYKGPTQKARVITETWVGSNLYCPFCGSGALNHFDNNKPVADFYCDKCGEEYELKSMSKPIGKKVTGSGYDKMIERITSDNNPNFLFLHYDRSHYLVENLVLIPKYFFTPDIVEKRKPLGENARRAGWVGCNFRIGSIPEAGYIEIIKDGIEIPKEMVIDKTRTTSFMRSTKMDSRGWISDVLKCIDSIKGEHFVLQDVYSFEDELSQKHPNNKHVRDKIRQQLQILREMDIISFEGRGVYSKK